MFIIADIYEDYNNFKNVKQLILNNSNNIEQIEQVKEIKQLENEKYLSFYKKYNDLKKSTHEEITNISHIKDLENDGEAIHVGKNHYSQHTINMNKKKDYDHFIYLLELDLIKKYNLFDAYDNLINKLSNNKIKKYCTKIYIFSKRNKIIKNKNRNIITFCDIKINKIKNKINVITFYRTFIISKIKTLSE